MTRKTSPEMINALKTAFKSAIFNAGGLLAAASCTRVRPTHLSDYGNINAEKMPPVDVVLDIELITGAYPVTAAMALANGCLLVPIAPLREKDELAVLLAKMGQDVGEIFATAAQALSHKRLTPKERAKLLAEMTHLHGVTQETIQVLRQGGEG